MDKVEIGLGIEQILEGMRQLSDQDKRTLAAVVLSDPRLEPFVEELDDQLTCERALDDEPPRPFTPPTLTRHSADYDVWRNPIRR